ncbi:MAG: DNA primase [Thermodesulfobacteriota bacterium]
MEEYIPDEVIAEVRSRADIVEVISEYLPLKKAGRNYSALCPFHPEKTPSFMVSSTKQVFHCFGCGIGGDIFGFVMKSENLSFPQVVKVLAKKFGVPIPQRRVPPSVKREIDRKEQLLKVNQLAMGYYRDLLFGRNGTKAREYLRKRGIGKAVIEEHRLGYALHSWDGLVNHLHGKKVPLNLAQELGLVIPKKTGGWYDHFRGRIIFPIFDLTGNVLGFGGRTLDENSPKYLNSPESALYHKGQSLYGLHVAKGFIREKGLALIVEGYLDLLTLHQFGYKHSVATLGTAMTESHIRLLRRFSSHFITIFDSDESGVAATIRALPLFLEEEISCTVVRLPGKHDPDSFLQGGHRDEFQEMLLQAIPIFDFFIDEVLSGSDLASADGKARAINEIFPMLERIRNPIVRESYVKKLGERLVLKEEVILDAIRTLPQRRERKREELKQAIHRKMYPKTEETILEIMLRFNHLIPEIAEDGVLEDFENQQLKMVAKTLKEIYFEKGAVAIPDILADVEDDELRNRISKWAFLDGTFEGASLDKTLRDCFRKVKMDKLRRDEEALLSRIKEVEKEDRQDLLGELLAKRQHLLTRERNLMEMYKN